MIGLEDIVSSQSKQDAILAQGDQRMEKSQGNPTLTPVQFEQLIQAQASHAIMQKFQQEYSKTQLIEIYSVAYKFHRKEAEKFKAMLTQLSGNLVLDLDKPDI